MLLSESTLAWLLLLVSIVVASGLFYVLAERPPFSLGAQLIYPGTGAQTVSELIMVAFLYALSMSGLLLIYEAPRYRSRQGLALMFLLSGVTATLVSVLLLLAIYGIK